MIDLEALTVPAWTTDDAGAFLSCNEAFRGRFGSDARAPRQSEPSVLIPLAGGQQLGLALHREVPALVAARAEIERLREELARVAVRDPVTGALHARELHRVLRLEVDRCRRYGRAFTLLVVQIVGFEALSERLAQVGTEAVLTLVARAVLEGRRSVDVLGRLDGGRFALVLPETPVANGGLLAERTRRAVEAIREAVVPASGAPVAVAIRVKVGVAGFPGASADPDALLAEAARAARA